MLQFATLNTLKSDTYSANDSRYLYFDGTPQYDSGEKVLNITTTLIPFMKVPTSVGGTFSKMSTSQYSKSFKNTKLNKGLTAQQRGQINKKINWGIEKINGQLAPQSFPGKVKGFSRNIDNKIDY